MLLLSVSEEFWEISAFEDKDNTVPRKGAIRLPTDAALHPIRTLLPVYRRATFIIHLGIHTTFQFVCYVLPQISLC